ncbi:MAG: DNA polymerase I [Desulfovibrio sp.]|nr:DNA polymerase I [Desulfovibrio sp.]
MSLKERLNFHEDPVFLMDGSAFIYRGFFANQNMRRSDGFPTNALVVVTRVLLRILREERPVHFLFVKDGHGKTFRHDLYPQYKANRDAPPEDLIRQIEPILQMVRGLGFSVEISEGCEADDCIASLAARFSARLPVIIVSGDKDLKQCLAPNVFMWDPTSREEKLISAASFTAEKGITPERWPDMQALIGDSIDNIPGVPGIGPKTAEKILAICPTLEDIRDNFSRLPNKLQDKLRNHLKDMFLWRQLTTLSRDRCSTLQLEDTLVKPLNPDRCAALADEYELRALRREISILARRQESFSIVSKSKSRMTPTSGSGLQTNLLDIPVDPPAPAIDDINDLPCANAKQVAVIWTTETLQPPRVAVDEGTDIRWTGSMPLLAEWLAKTHRIVMADLKFPPAQKLVRDVLRACEKTPEFFDLGLAAYLINPEENDYSWTQLAMHWGHFLRHNAKDKCGAAMLALLMADYLQQRLEADCLLKLYRELELPLIPVLADMEAYGVPVSAKALHSFLDDVQQDLDRLTQTVYATAGTTFNIRSSQQLGDVLYRRLALPVPRKTKGGLASTNQETLESLAGKHPVVDSVLQFRKLEKMRSTYLDPLPRLVDKHGRIHTTFNQKATATGRLSSSNPNLQNIPIRGSLGKRMRDCFVAESEHVLLSADYSQVELRVLAHMSQDPALLDAFRKGEDIHARTAALIYDLDSEKVSNDQRRNAKTINFGLIYGMGAQKLARELKISLAESREFIARYFERLSGLKAFYENVEAEAKRHGFVTTMGGRRRLLPDINSPNGQANALARRQAINTVIQGSAADIIKLAMLAVARDTTLRNLNAHLLLQIHDELVLEVPAETADNAGSRVAFLMSEVQPGGNKLSVPLVVDWGKGQSWGEAHQ